MNCTAKQRRRAAWILLVGFLLVILVSLTFCAEEVNHDCTGADCAVCAQLKLCENILHIGKDRSGQFIRTLAPHFVLAACRPEGPAPMTATVLPSPFLMSLSSPR